MRLTQIARQSARPFAALLGCFLFPATSSAGDRHDCQLRGRYTYNLAGTGYSAADPVPFDEIGTFSVAADGGLRGESTGAIAFPNFRGQGAVWMLVRHQFANGLVTPSQVQPCSGTVDVLVTTTVLKSSNPAVVSAETVLVQNAAHSIAYTVAAGDGSVRLLLTSPGDIGNGLATPSAPRRR